MNDQRLTRWPCSADSSRKAGDAVPPAHCPRSLRKAETGVSQSSMKVWRSGTRLCRRARSRTSYSDGVTRRRWGWRAGSAWSATAAKEHLLRVGECPAAAVEQDREVVEHVGGLLVDAVVGLLARGAGDLLGLLLHLGADERRVLQQRDGVGPRRPRAGAIGQRPLEGGERLVRRGRLEVALEEAGPLAGVAGRAGRLDERQQRVAVAVAPQRTD